MNVLPFLLHAHFWAISPERHDVGKVFSSGDEGGELTEVEGVMDSGRNELTKFEYWNRGLAETKIWSKMLVEKLGVETIEQLALWSVKRLIAVGRVPRKTAVKIGLLLGMLERELDKWAWSNGESVLDVGVGGGGSRLVQKLVPGVSVSSVPSAFL